MPDERPAAAPLKPFDCSDCMAFCCTVYELVSVEAADVRRLARHFKITEQVFLKFYTRTDANGQTVLRRKPDPASDQCCTFLNIEERRCSVYDARPAVCRDFPVRGAAAPGAQGRCAYYDLYTYTRRESGDPCALPVVQIKRIVKGDGNG